MSRPSLEIPYAAIASARKGSRSKSVNIACPVCGPQREGEAAKRKVMRTWMLNNHGISVHCVRCGLEGWVAPDGGTNQSARSKKPAVSADFPDDDDDRERQRKAELVERIWRESVPIAGTAGEAYLNRRGIDLAAVPDHGGLRWHARCPWGAYGETTGCIISRFSDAITGEPGGIHRRPIAKGEKPKTLGPMSRRVIRLWPDAEVTSGLVLGEGIETTLAAATRITHRNTMLQPAWAAGSAGNMASLPVLAGVEALTLLVDNDANGTGQNAAAQCAQRWLAGGRDVIRLTPKTVGKDFNNIIQGSAA
jgi:Toprim domain